MEGHIKRMTADHWSGVLCRESEIHHPTWEDVATAVSALDAQTRTMVCLFGADDATLTIGGGGRHVILLSTATGSMWTLLSPNRSASEIELLNCGGQEGDYPANQVVDTAMALKAASSFYLNGTRSNDLTWSREA